MKKTLQKKVLPYSVSKTELVDMYLDQMSEKEILTRINAIFNLAKLSTYKKRVPHNQFNTFYETYGLPKGYFISDDD